MTSEQQRNIDLIIKSLNKFGITNQYLQAGILATVSKEADFIPKSESLYYKTAEGLKKTYPSIFPTIESAKPYVGNSEATANKVYGGKYGNTDIGDGYKFRGRGFHQLTFKGNYDKYGKMIGVDLVSNPERLNDPQIAADVLAAFFSEELKNAVRSGKIKNYGVSDTNQIKDTLTGTRIAIQTNAGWGKDINNSVDKKGLNDALEKVNTLYNYTNSVVADGLRQTQRNPIGVTLLVIGLIASAYVIYNRKELF